ncbi:MAG TPA: type II toxin-antitoxin system Phd/YefM family antitoxin [Rhodospirillaceae bacterium]|nr:type II toxin-antitoxin system Phd/YefM family antitoxin [Rhodospirillaceae bacterium]
MSTVSLKAAKAGFSSLVDDAIRGEFVTITRHGKPVATLVSVAAADIARKALGKTRPGLVSYLRTIPDGDFDRNSTPSRDVDL